MNFLLFFVRTVCLECWMWLRNTQEIRVEVSLITQEQVSHGDQLTKSSSLRAMDHKYSPLGQMLKCSRHQSRWFFDHKNPPLVLKWMLQRNHQKMETWITPGKCFHGEIIEQLAEGYVACGAIFGLLECGCLLFSDFSLYLSSFDLIHNLYTLQRHGWPGAQRASDRISEFGRIRTSQLHQHHCQQLQLLKHHICSYGSIWGESSGQINNIWTQPNSLNQNK